MIKIILIAVAVIIVAVAIIAAMQPSDFRITRSTRINAPAASVFPHINDLQKWKSWSPWAKLDPDVKESFEGPPAGTGAVMHWAGNNQVGEGSMTITESRANQLIRFRLEFLKPFAATNTAEFIFEPDGGHTTVTWSMFGHNNFTAKVIGLFINCEKMVGGQFEQGLAQMKAVVETAAAQ
jgi:uncharacterized protein YndB with AHSA1/START domain